MANAIPRPDLVAGIWNFSVNVGHDELVQLAKQWVDEDVNYKQICVRGTSRNTFGIQFVYRCEGVNARDADEETSAYRKWFYKMTDQLKRRFGNDLVSWDISSSSTDIVPDRNILRP